MAGDGLPGAGRRGGASSGAGIPRAALARDLAALYARVDAEVAAANPRCDVSGRCCDFPRSGQRLYATDLESAHAAAVAGGVPQGVAAGSCAWYQEGLCRSREGRPLGCRLYFCDPAWEDRMPPLYERYHAELKALHERHGLPYRYRLFVDAVAEQAP
jgi:Fe-S-cluster containining protein